MGGGAVIDTVNNCGYLAGEQIIFSSYDECLNFISMYGPTLVADGEYSDESRVVAREYNVYTEGNDYSEMYFSSLNFSQNFGRITF